MSGSLPNRPDGGPLVKVCGLRRVADLDAVQRAGADLGGIVFAPSRRQMQPEAARDLLGAVPHHPPIVGVFVNVPAAEINEVSLLVGLHYVQLSGQEGPTEAERVELPYLKTLHLREGATAEAILHIMNQYRGAVGFLLDSWSPLGGGSGQVADWTIAAEVLRRSDRTVLLAGGLHVENVAAGLAQTRAAGVDVSSGVERDGWKDRTLIADFVGAVRRLGAVPLSP